jgi:hypothetical protein
MRIRIGTLLILLFLTLTVITLDYQFFNVPCSMYLNAYKTSYSEGEHLTSFHMQLPSAGFPQEYRNVTEDIDFRGLALDYVKASDTVRDIIKIPEQSSAEWWFKNASNSSKGYDMTIQFYNDSYYLQLRYFPDFYRAPIEYTIIWIINIVTIIGWVLFTIKSVLTH